MEYFAYVVAFFIVVGLLMVGFGYYEAHESKGESASAKLQRIREQRGSLAPQGMDGYDVEARELAKKFAREEEARLGRDRSSMTGLDEIIKALRVTARLEGELRQINSFWHAGELLVATLMLALVVLLATTLMGWGWFGLIPALACIRLPWVYVRSLRARYYRRFDEQLADTLMLMSNSLRAGFSFLQALEMVAREAPFPIANEFSMVTQEISLGVSITQALENLGARIKSSDLDLVVTAVIIQRETGGGLAEILDTIAGVIHERMRIKGEIRTLTAQGRLTGAVLGFLPVFLGLGLHLVSRISAPHDPSFMTPLLNEGVGRIMIAVALVLQLMGFAWIMKIVTIRV
ncbi:MAG: tight adherence protein [Abditibacteriota bacterium]|nr:tight adherence protein [Abditibacteriota bacterium]